MNIFQNNFFFYLFLKEKHVMIINSFNSDLDILLTQKKKIFKVYF